MTLPIALLLSCSFAMARAALRPRAESTTPVSERALDEADTTERALEDADTTEEPEIGSGAPAPTIDLNAGFLDPSGSAYCPSRCANYFAGARASDAIVCQKQASGVGTPEQNAELGVACYPSYGCGRDMIACVNHEWYGSGPVPNTSDAEAACSGLAGLVTENPWTCDGMERNPTPCNHITPNNNIGKWLKGTADLGCGWGADSVDDPTRTVFYSGTNSDYECCLKAMMHEHSPWDQGGAALRFQFGHHDHSDGGTLYRVDREQFIYGNLDSSSGFPIKYAEACTPDGDDVPMHYFYRHGAGAADAANLHTGGRCAVEGGFQRVEGGTTNMPYGELPDGNELPNHNCDNAALELGLESHEGCDATIRVNTIADAEACCEFCRTLPWLGTADYGGSATQTDGVHDNPCVAWQIVEGKCRIVRRVYFNHWNGPGSSIRDAILEHTSYDPAAPGNSDWVIAHRGCNTDAWCNDGICKDPDTWCNYFSYIYYRELGTDTSNVSDANATYRKIVTTDLPQGSDNLTMELEVDVVGDRHGTRDEIRTDGNETIRDSTEFSGPVEDCGSVEVYERDACSDTASSGFTVVTEESLANCAPICSSACVVGGRATVSCRNLSGEIDGRRLRRGERRLSRGEGPSLLISFSSRGSGYDLVNFRVATAGYDAGAPATTSEGDDQNGIETSFAPGDPANPVGSTTPAPPPPLSPDSDPSSSRRLQLPVAPLVSFATFAAAASTCQ